MYLHRTLKKNHKNIYRYISVRTRRLWGKIIYVHSSMIIYCNSLYKSKGLNNNGHHLLFLHTQKNYAFLGDFWPDFFVINKLLYKYINTPKALQKRSTYSPKTKW